MRTLSLGLSLVTACAFSVFAQAASAQAPGTTPQGLDPEHYHCYEAKNTQPLEIPAVSLRDQFNKNEGVKVLRLRFICAPVSKNGERLGDKLTHLVCYTIEGAKPAEKRVVTRNQFGEAQYDVGASRLLCLPSLKRIVRPPV